VVDLETKIVVEEAEAVAEVMEHQTEVVEDHSILRLNLRLSLPLFLACFSC
jgi:hypothetical protein